jgi:hypothetical protein
MTALQINLVDGVDHEVRLVEWNVFGALSGEQLFGIRRSSSHPACGCSTSF